MQPVSYTITSETITIVTGDGKSITVGQGSVQFFGLAKALVESDWDAVEKQLSPAGSLQQWIGANSGFTVQGSAISYMGEPVTQSVQSRIWLTANEGKSPAPLFAFWARLQLNPSYRSVQQLFEFLQHRNIPIEEDGTFLAYKAVQGDLKDIHSSTFDNSPGKTHSMPRNKISDDPMVECDEGFHVGALAYVQWFGSNRDDSARVVICRVDPADVVSVPRDHSAQKIRVCKYTVIGFYTGQPMPSTTVERDYADDESDDDGGGEMLDNDVTSMGAEMSSRLDAGMPAPPAPTTKSRKRKPSSNKLRRFAKLNAKALMEESIDNLRAYAAKLKIVGASKLPGGKTALVGHIMKNRRRVR